MGYKETYEAWLANPYFDEATKDELRLSQGMTKRSKSVFMQIWNLAQLVCGELSELVQTA